VLAYRLVTPDGGGTPLWNKSGDEGEWLIL
jgi:hypothetical protein